MKGERRVRNLIVCLVVTTALLASRGAAAPAELVISKYSSTAEKDSISFKYDGEEDQSAFTGLFRGFGGYQLEHLCGDERSWINVKFGDKRADLREATMKIGAATGSFPHKANDTVEWRGIEAGGRFKPYAIIYRLVGVDENGKRKRSRLIVIKLDKEQSAVVGFAEGANEDAEAKEIADRSRR